MHTDHTPRGHAVADTTTIVLLDPTNHDGEAGLAILTEADAHVALVLLLSGRTSAALREYATAEGITLADAGFIYLDQVAGRVATPGRVIETILASGPDAVHELSVVASEREVARVVLPPSSHRLDRVSVVRLRAELPGVDVVVASLSTVG